MTNPDALIAKLSPATVKIGRWYRDAEEMLVVAVAIGSEAPISRVIEARDAVAERSAQLVEAIEGAVAHGEPRLRGGWHPAVIQEIRVPRGAGVKHGFQYQKSKL